MDYKFGPRVDEKGVTFRLWAPSARGADLDLELLVRPGDRPPAATATTAAEHTPEQVLDVDVVAEVRGREVHSS